MAENMAENMAVEAHIVVGWDIAVAPFALDTEVEADSWLVNTVAAYIEAVGIPTARRDFRDSDNHFEKN